MNTIKLHLLAALLLSLLLLVAGGLSLLANTASSPARNLAGEPAGTATSPPTIIEINADGPTPDPTDVALQQYHADLFDILYTQPGIILAQSVSTPLPDARVKSYRVEEVQLPRPTQFAVDPITKQVWANQEVSLVRAAGIGLEGKNIVTLDKVWRVSITMDTDNPPGYALTWEMWLDGTHLGRGPTAVFSDWTILREGAQLGLSYGMGPVVTLPDRLPFIDGP